ncbi:MAG TPA: ribonuclease D, partial [Acidiphilium sp.]
MSQTQFAAGATIHIHRNDLPDGVGFGAMVAIDTETMGLDPRRDRLCLVQLSAGDGVAHLVQIVPESLGGRGADCPNLRRLLTDPGVTKLFHFARFDVAMLYHALGVTVSPVICTKIASKLVRTYTDRHGLKDLCRDLIGVEISKQQQTSDWGALELSPEQCAYAASDVLHLHAIWARLDALLVREGRRDIARGCYDFLPVRA